MTGGPLFSADVVRHASEQAQRCPGVHFIGHDEPVPGCCTLASGCVFVRAPKLADNFWADDRTAH